MNRPRSFFILPVALLLFIAATHHPGRRLHATATQEPVAQAQAQEFTGVYVLEGPAQETVTQAIVTGTANMNFIKRPIARSRLKKTNLPPYAWVKIEHTPAEVSIQMDGRKPILTPADGKMIKWTREDGEVFDVNTVWEEGKLRETFKAGDGSRENLFSLSPDGSVMTMQVTIRSPQLKQPIVYKLDYRRKTA